MVPGKELGEPREWEDGGSGKGVPVGGATVSAVNSVVTEVPKRVFGCPPMTHTVHRPLQGTPRTPKGTPTLWSVRDLEDDSHTSWVSTVDIPARGCLLLSPCQDR